MLEVQPEPAGGHRLAAGCREVLPKAAKRPTEPAAYTSSPVIECVPVRREEDGGGPGPHGPDPSGHPAPCGVFCGADEGGDRRRQHLYSAKTAAKWGGELRKHFSKERCSQTAMPFFAVFPLYFGLFLSPVQNQMHR